MSETPRTDAQEQWIQQVRDGAGIVVEEFLLVRMSYAEQLERELSATQVENRRLREALRRYVGKEPPRNLMGGCSECGTVEVDHHKGTCRWEQAKRALAEQSKGGSDGK